jgi:hypothetical protein
MTVLRTRKQYVIRIKKIRKYEKFMLSSESDSFNPVQKTAILKIKYKTPFILVLP